MPKSTWKKGGNEENNRLTVRADYFSRESKSQRNIFSFRNLLFIELEARCITAGSHFVKNLQSLIGMTTKGVEVDIAILGPDFDYPEGRLFFSEMGVSFQFAISISKKLSHILIKSYFD